MVVDPLAALQPRAQTQTQASGWSEAAPGLRGCAGGEGATSLPERLKVPVASEAAKRLRLERGLLSSRPQWSGPQPALRLLPAWCATTPVPPEVPGACGALPGGLELGCRKQQRLETNTKLPFLRFQLRKLRHREAEAP